MVAFFYLHLAGCAQALGNSLAVNRRYGPRRRRRNLHDKLLLAAIAKATGIANRPDSAYTGKSAATLDLAEEIRRLLLDQIQKFLDIRTASIEARDKLVPSRLVKFRRKRQRRPEHAHTCLANVVGSDVLARFHKATAFAVFDGFTRRQHLLDILAGHDGVVLHRGQFLDSLFTQDVRKILSVRKRYIVFRASIGSRFKHGHVSGKSARSQKTQN